ncbi:MULTISPECIES: hypothetical protein [Chelativorans]|jgi:hypothetical protein|uniref:hypothetical protein n=1 Tax=Chelativorans TaxID=449972 RepID=UPI0003006CF3|nr:MULTISPECIES: hypothetical protein [Chelativorans]
MPVRASLTEYLRHYAALWRRRRAERLISSLPPEIQKDIGWPSAGAPTQTLYRAAGPGLGQP